MNTLDMSDPDGDSKKPTPQEEVGGNQVVTSDDISERQQNNMNNKVCSKCGGKLTIQQLKENSCFTDHKEVVTNEVVCRECSVITNGVDREVFELARKLVVDFDFKYYSHLSPRLDGEEYCIRANTDGAIRLAYWILNRQTFTVNGEQYELASFGEKYNDGSRHATIRLPQRLTQTGADDE